MLTTTDPLNFLLYSSKLNLGATVKDLESKQVLQILAEPTITTISGVKADFLSGGEFPFPDGSSLAELAAPPWSRSSFASMASSWNSRPL